MTEGLGIPMRLGAKVDLYEDEWLHSAISRWAWKPFGVSRAALFRSLGLADLAPHKVQAIGTFLSPDVARNIAFATGIDEERLREATMASLDGKAIIFRGQKQSRNRVWSRRAGTRYCPDCIADRPGYFSLYWRLPWVFACLEHRRLLRDTCAVCQRETVEMRGRNTDVFDPATCRADTAAGTASRRHPCLAALGNTGGEPHLDERWKLAVVQEAILGQIHDGSAWRTLTDLQAAATGLRGARAFDVIAELSGVAESELQGLFDDEKHVGISPPKDALAMGALTAAAWALCRTVDETKARQIIRRVTFDRPPVAAPRGAGYRAGSPTELVARWGDPLAAFRGHILRALDADLTVSQRILWDTARAGAAIDDQDEHHIRQRWLNEAHVPRQIWPTWCSRMDVGGPVKSSVLATALSIVLCQLGRGDHPGVRRDLASVLRPNMLGSSRETTLILRTLSHLAASLRSSPPAINYERRIVLGCRPMLTAETWSTLSELRWSPGTENLGFINAQRYLWQRFTGSSATNLPPALRLGVTRDDVYDYSLFRIRMTAELQRAFDDISLAFLQDEGIAEPVVWSPPLRGTFECAGSEIDDIDVARLHELLLKGLVSRRRLSSELQVSERQAIRAIDAFPPSVDATALALEWTAQFHARRSEIDK